MKGNFAAHHGHQERFVLGFDLFPELEEANKNRLTYGVAIAAGLSPLKVNVIEGVIFLNSLSGILCLSGFDRLLDRRLGGPTQTGYRYFSGLNTVSIIRIGREEIVFCTHMNNNVACC